MKDSQAVSTNRAVQSNWAALRAQIPVSVKPKAKKEKPEEVALAAAKVANKKKWERMLSSKILAVDCEMVGIGIGGKVSALARCSVVDFSGNVVYDNFVQPKGFVTDFRTKWSGIRKSDISARKAVSLEECQAAVAVMFKNKIIVGHSLKNDLSALLLSHPKSSIRDTSRHRPYMRKHGAKFRPRALRDLTKEHLGKIIQDGEHDSVEDARCALELYKLRMEEWEEELREQKKARMLPKKSHQQPPNQGEASHPSAITEDQSADRSEDEEVDDVASHGVGGSEDEQAERSEAQSVPHRKEKRHLQRKRLAADGAGHSVKKPRRS